MAALLRRFAVWLPWALPFAGAVLGPAFIGGAGHWAIKAVSGSLVGLSTSFIIWQTKTVPPYSTWLGASAAVAFGLPLLLLAMFAWNSDLGTYVVAFTITAGLGWALTR